MPDKVYVISRLGHPLMPCSPAKARHLLDDKKAKVVKRMPFTIRLLYGSTKYIQPIILGVDAGSKTIGLWQVRRKRKCLLLRSCQGMTWWKTSPREESSAVHAGTVPHGIGNLVLIIVCVAITNVGLPLL